MDELTYRDRQLTFDRVFYEQLYRSPPMLAAKLDFHHQYLIFLEQIGGGETLVEIVACTQLPCLFALPLELQLGIGFSYYSP